MKQAAYLITLTPLRGIAALLVVLFHAGIFIGPLAPPETTGLISHGWLWVDFFFVLSGFVLLHVYGNLFQEKLSWTSYKQYLFARFARIYPLHFITLLMAVALIILLRALAADLMPILKAMFDLRSIPATLMLMQSLHLFETPPLNAPAWSLSTEWWVYVLFPLLVRPLYKLGRLGQAGSLMAIAALYLLLMYYVAPNFGNLIFRDMGMNRGATIDMTADWGYFRCLAGFVLGLLLYRFYLERRGYQLLKSGWVFIGLFAAVLAGMHYNIHEMAILGLFPLLILASAYNADFVRTFLSFSPLQKLGDWSFSIYMVHMLLVYGYWSWLLVENPHALFQMSVTPPDYGVNWLLSIVLLLTTLITARFTYRYMEVPAREHLSTWYKGKQLAEKRVAAA